MSRPLQNVVYLRIRRKWLGVQILTFTGRVREWAGTPEAIFTRDRKGKERAYVLDDPMQHAGAARQSFVAFDHPRVPFSNFGQTQETLRAYLEAAGWKKGLLPHTFIFHLLDDWEGGLSDIEVRAFIQMGREIGAGTCLVVNSREEMSIPHVLRMAKQRQTMNRAAVTAEAPFAIEP